MWVSLDVLFIYNFILLIFCRIVVYNWQIIKILFIYYLVNLFIAVLFVMTLMKILSLIFLSELE